MPGYPLDGTVRNLTGEVGDISALVSDPVGLSTTNISTKTGRLAIPCRFSKRFCLDYDGDHSIFAGNSQVRNEILRFSEIAFEGKLTSLLIADGCTLTDSRTKPWLSFRGS